MRDFGERVLGKGGVIAKDTPNFIGNRLGSFAGMQSVTYAFENGYGIEEVDAMTGPLIGHPKTATFRLNDTVGLDIAVGVAENLYEAVPEDESREELKPHPILEGDAGEGPPGQQDRRGLLQARQAGRARRSSTCSNTRDLRARAGREPRRSARRRGPRSRETSARGCASVVEKADEDRHARYVRDTLLPYLAYASRRVPEISDTLEDVDHAMEWGFAHEAGPFRTWDLLGVRETVEGMDDLGIEVGHWVREMLDGGNESFYKTEDGERAPVQPRQQGIRAGARGPDGPLARPMREEGGEVSRNDSASLLDLGDGVLCLEFHSKGNSIDGDGVKMGYEALQRLENEDWVGLVVGNEGRNFCVGANLGEIAHAAQNGMLEEIGESVDALQGLLMGFRFAPKPVVAAPHGQTLGGGLEICLHADRVVAAGEAYMGLVEAGVGLIPAGGGTKEMARRLVSRAAAHGRGHPAAPVPAKGLRDHRDGEGLRQRPRGEGTAASWTTTTGSS